MKILNSEVINNPIAHLFELSDTFAINGALYNKNPMYPLPLKYGLLSDPIASVYFKETYDLSENCQQRYRKNVQTYVVDNNNLKTHYTFYDNLGIFKMVETDFGVDITKFEFTPEETYFSIDYSLQTDKNLVFLISYSNKTITFIIDKVDLSVIGTTEFTGYAKSLGYFYDEMTDNYFLHVLYSNYTTSNRVDFISININTLAKTMVGFIKINSSNNGASMKPNGQLVTGIIKIDNVHSYFLQYYVGDDKPNIIGYTITNASEASTIYNELNYEKYPETTYYNVDLYNPENNYFIMAAVNQTILNTKKSHLTCSYFKNLTNFKTGWTSNEKFSNSKSINLLANNDTLNDYIICGSTKKDKIVFFGSNDKISIYMWDTNEKTYIICNEIYDNIRKICVDSNDFIWIYNESGELYTVDYNYTEYQIYLSSNETDFDYDGEDIYTYFIAKVLNANGENIRCKVTLKIYGPAKFTNNGNQTIDLYLNGEELEVPITIFDQGLINIVYLD